MRVKAELKIETCLLKIIRIKSGLADMLSALVDYNDTSSALKYWSKNTGVQIGSRLDQKIVGFLDRKNMGLVKWYTWPLKFLLRTGRYATALNDVERGRISSSLLFIPMLPPWPFSRHAVRSRKIREFSFIIPLTLDTRTHTNMDRFNPFLHTEVDQFNPLTLTNLYYLQYDCISEREEGKVILVEGSVSVRPWYDCISEREEGKVILNGWTAEGIVNFLHLAYQRVFFYYQFYC